MENLVEARGLCKNWPRFTLGPMDLTVPAGSIVGLVGENGAGKTTTLKLLLGILRADGGSVRLLGSEPGDREALAQVGVVFEDAFFHQSLCPEQIGGVLANVYRTWDAPLYKEYCERFGLPGRQPIREFSRGMRMKLSLSAALAHHPRLLILDEATSGLDPVVRGEMLDLFLEFIQDESRGILMSSHITGDLEKVADEVAYLHRDGQGNGRMLFQRNKDELLEQYGLLRCSHEDVQRLPGELLVHLRQGAYSCEALVSDRAAVIRCLPNAVCDPASIEDIMRFYAGRDAE